MADQPIRFVDGAGYERAMGVWSRSAGEIFLDWVKPPKGLAWADVGCGNGAFTELLVERCAPSRVIGVDPSPEQIAYARTRHRAGIGTFEAGDAMALPIPDRSVDAATMALVIFFVPEPERGVAEMVRVVRPGGLIAAYAWDLLGGGFPWEPVHEELRTLGYDIALAPRADVSPIAELTKLWEGAGLESIESRTITVERVFPDFEDFWASASLAGTLRTVLPGMDAKIVETIKSRLKARFLSPNGQLNLTARANTIKGIAPI